MPKEGNCSDLKNCTFGVATSNPDKFQRFLKLGERVGIDATLVPLKPPSDVPELTSNREVDVGLDKASGMADAFEEKDTFRNLALENVFLDYLICMDVLPEADKRLNLPIERAIMKKPKEGQTALEAFTGYFGNCLAAIEQINENAGGRVKDQITQLEITYNLIMAIAPINQQTWKVERERTRVEWDKIKFIFSLPLVKFLADPNNIRELGHKGFALDALLSDEAVSGVKIQALIPMIAELAVMNSDDDLTMWVHYHEYNKKQYLRKIDKPSDLECEDCEIMIGREEDEEEKRMMTLSDFIKYAVKGLTPRLLWKIFMQPKQLEKRETQRQRGKERRSKNIK